MKISLNWLKKYIDLSGLSVDDIVSNLTMSGLEVEEVINETEIYGDFIVGLVKEKVKHPNADKLSVCTVYTGKEDLQVICGAPNVDTGQKIVFAPIGTLIPKGNFKIGKAKIRGVESFGMICAEDELELGDDHSGIMILSPDLKEGTPVTKALGLNDVIMEIAITPNRSDALSHIGVARDLAAIFDRKMEIEEISLDETEEKTDNYASVEIEDAENCPRYTARVVLNVVIKESPLWLKERLTKIGLRPINNIVDVTNYVMYETGQPLHAFDLDRLSGQKIIVRSTNSPEKFTTLDSKERALPLNTLMICDGQKPVAIAGIMGGENSEIYAETKNILIESAHFNPSSIRKASKLLGLNTEASYRFERWVDPNGTIYAAERAAQLIAELGEGKITKGLIDRYPKVINEKEVPLRYKQIKRILGYDIQKEKVLRTLTGLGLQILFESEEDVRFKVPTKRPDLEREIDIIEEIARINGYDNIPTVERIAITLGAKIDESGFADIIKEFLTGLGLFEMINNPLQSEKVVSVSGNKIAVLNPQSIDMAYLRTSLIIGALPTIAKNINVGERDLELFEIGNVFNKKPEVDEIKSFEDFSEEQKIVIVLTGRRRKKDWQSGEIMHDLYSLKGVVESLLMKISLDNVLTDSYYHNENTIFDYYFAKNLGETQIGIGGLVKKSVLKKFDIQQEVFCFEFNIGLLKNIKKTEKKYTELLKYPKVIRDFAFVFGKDITYNEVMGFIKRSSSKLLKTVQLFDIFTSEQLGDNKQSMAFSLEYFAEDRTLTEEEVEKEFNSLIAAITKKFNAKLRGN